MKVKLSGTNEPDDIILVRCRGGMFRQNTVTLKQSYMWIIDCCRGGGRHGDSAWTDDRYTQLKLWMTDIQR